MRLNKEEKRDIINRVGENGSASLCICNTDSIIIYDFIYGIDDYVVWAYSDEKDNLRCSKLKTKYITEDYTENIFRIGNTWYNLDEFIKHNI